MCRDLHNNRWLPGEREAAHCLTKLTYETGAQAAKALKHMQRGKSKFCKRMAIYRCEFCGKHHIGRDTFSRRPRKQRHYLPADS